MNGRDARPAASRSAEAADAAFARQFAMRPREFLDGLDFFAWTRHFHLLKDLCAATHGDVLEVGSGDGVLRRCAEPYLRSYRVLDRNAELAPDVQGDVAEWQPALAGRFDAVVVAEVLEHLPFERFEVCLAHLHGYLRTGGRLYLTLPHRK
jgi:cyclopropane fatty-acyl-phospholipid synthase-like methyltransferase